MKTASTEREGLSEENRVAWIRTVLALSDSEANRRAFMAGYNGNECPPPVTASKAERWKQGLRVHDILNKDQDHGRA